MIDSRRCNYSKKSGEKIWLLFIFQAQEIQNI